MKIEHLAEPLLEFGTGQHVDVRFGIAQHWPRDREMGTAPREIRVGLVGTQETTEALSQWLADCAQGVTRKDSPLINLFPAFPGFNEDSCFGARLMIEERWTAAISKSDIRELSEAKPTEIVDRSVATFLDEARRLLENNALDVIICAPPHELLAELDSINQLRGDDSERGLDEGSEDESEADNKSVRLPDFHDVLKARGMILGVPLQMIRPPTYGGKIGKKKTDTPSWRRPTLQDPATRAWNFHTALYYKAGGIPWRLLRDPADLSSCYAGVSFYRSLDGERVLTSVAQVFNERGEGIIVRGAQAQVTKTDRQPHLSETDAHALLKRAITTFRREHKHTPARIVIHKTSMHTPGEVAGFQAAATEERIEVVDLLAVARSFTRLFRQGVYPPLRGTLLHLSSDRAILYLRGSVEFFEAYPGMYVPRPLELKLEHTESTSRQLAAEILALSKLNWNNTQFDGGEPITVRAARQVGDILKCIPEEDDTVQPGFRFFM